MQNTTKKLKRVKTQEEQALSPHTFRKKTLQAQNELFNQKRNQKLLTKLKKKHKQEYQIITDRQFTLGFAILTVIFLIAVYIIDPLIN